MPLSERFLRDAIVALTAPLPRGARARARAYLRGRLEVARFRGADFAVLSRAKSGRTWLRAMLWLFSNSRPTCSNTRFLLETSRSSTTFDNGRRFVIRFMT